MQRHALRTEKQLARAEHIGVLAGIEGIAKDDVNELIEKKMGHLAAAADNVEIGPLERGMRDQQIAERQHHPPVLARIGVRDGCNIGGRNDAARRGKQGCMQAPFGVTRIGRRRQLGASHIDLQKIIRQQQRAAVVTIQKMMAARQPEIPYLPKLRSVRSGQRGPLVSGSSHRGVAVSAG